MFDGEGVVVAVVVVGVVAVGEAEGPVAVLVGGVAAGAVVEGAGAPAEPVAPGVGVVWGDRAPPLAGAALCSDVGVAADRFAIALVRQPGASATPKVWQLRTAAPRQ